MPDLGKYGAEVVSAYIGTIGLLAVLIVLTWLRSRRVRAALEQAEARKKNG